MAGDCLLDVEQWKLAHPRVTLWARNVKNLINSKEVEMPEVYCEGCGHSFPQKRKDLVPCPHCGREKHIPGVIQCAMCNSLSKRGIKFCADCGAALFKLCSRESSDCGDGPLDADYCSKCGAPLMEYEAFMANLEANREDAEWQRTKMSLGSIVVVGALLVAAWFFCVTPVGRWFSSLLQQSPSAKVLAPALTSAQAEATAQVQLELNTALFEDIEFRIGEISERSRGSGSELYATFPIILENRSESRRVILLSYDGKTIAYSPDWSSGPGTEYKEVTIEPNSLVEIVVTRRIQIYTRGAYLWVRLESVDSVLREQTSLAKKKWDWRFEIYDVNGVYN